MAHRRKGGTAILSARTISRSSRLRRASLAAIGRKARTVAANGKSCTVQADTATRTDSNGMSDAQAYSFAPNPEGATYELRLNKKGKWAVKGSPDSIFGMGYRSEYHDYSF